MVRHRAPVLLLALAAVAAPSAGTVASATPAAAAVAAVRPATASPPPEAPEIGAYRTEAGPVLLASREASGSVGVRWWTPETGVSAAPTDLGGQSRGGPAIAGGSGDQIGVFIRGTDDALWSNVRTGGIWSGWQSHGGVLSSRPAAIRKGPAGFGFDVYARGADGQLWGLTAVGAGGPAPRWQALGGGLAPGTGPSAREGVYAHDVTVLGVDGQHWTRTSSSGWYAQGRAGHGSPATLNAPVGGGYLGSTPLLFTRDSNGAPLVYDAYGPRPLGGHLASAPTATSNGRLDDRTDVFGVGADGVGYVNSRVGQSWTGWWPLSEADDWLQPDEVSAYRPDDGPVRVALCQWGGSVQVHTWDGANQLSEPTDLGGEVLGVAVTGRAGGSTSVFARGIDDALYTRTQAPGGGWGPWQNLGGVLAGTPSAVRFGGELHVFVTGSDGALWHKWSVQGGWSGWENLGGVLAEETAPAAVFRDDSDGAALEVAAFGASGDLYRIVHAAPYPGGPMAWSSWHALLNERVSSAEGNVYPDLAAVVAPRYSSPRPRTTTMLIGVTGNGSPHAYYDGRWEALSGELYSSPAAAGPSNGGNRQDVFGIGTDGLVHVQTRLTGAWQGWRSIG